VTVDSGTAALIRVENVERNGGTADPEDLRIALAILLGLAERGRAVEAASIYGRGPKAAVDLRLSGGEVVSFDTYSDVCAGSRLSAVLATTVGINRPFRNDEARRVACLIRWLAERHEEGSEDAELLDLAREYLRVARRIEVDFGAQLSRWQGFSELAACDPERQHPDSDVRERLTPLMLAARSPVLVDRATRTEYIRTGWFRQYVRRELGGVYDAGRLATRMERLGWKRPGREGRIMARCPTDDRSLVWTFYVVEAGWGAGP
jgi:hypothetical protein